MSTRRSPLKIALLVAGPPLGLRGVDGDLDRMAEQLRARDFTELIICRSSGATRTRLLAYLDLLVEHAEADDCVVFYYVGHGACARFAGGLHPGDEPKRIWRYLLTQPESEGFSGLLAVELSERICALTTITRNVTTILDCCFAAEIVRGAARGVELVGQLREFERPTTPRLLQTVERLCGHPALQISHAATIRLSATSREAKAHERFEAGHFTQRLTESLARADADSLPWSAHISRIREQVEQDRNSDSQLPELRGPGGRLPFRLHEVDFAGHMSFAGPDGERGGWIRAGRLHGLRPEAILEFPRTGEPSLIAHVTKEVEPHYARVEFEGEIRPQLGDLGFISGGVDRLAVAVRGTGSLAEQVEARLSGCVRLEHCADAKLVLQVNAQLELDGPDGDICLRRPLDQIDEMLTDLDAIARARSLTCTLSAHSDDSHEGLYDACAWSWRPFRYAGTQEWDLRSGDSLHVNDTIAFEFRNDSRCSTPHLFFNLLDRGLEHALTRMTYGHSTGVEISTREPRCELYTPQRGEGPISVCWAGQVPLDRPRLTTLYLIVSTTPLDLSPVLAGPPARGRVERVRAADAPVRDMRWAFTKLDVWVDPWPRS